MAKKYYYYVAAAVAFTLATVVAIVLGSATELRWFYPAAGILGLFAFSFWMNWLAAAARTPGHNSRLIQSLDKIRSYIADEAPSEREQARQAAKKCG